MTDMLEVLRRAIREGGVTPYRLEKETGVLRGSTLRFLRNEHVLRFDKAAALAEYLGYELRKVRKARKPRRARR